jgi:hypothetical protein
VKLFYIILVKMVYFFNKKWSTLIKYFKKIHLLICNVIINIHYYSGYLKLMLYWSLMERIDMKSNIQINKRERKQIATN